MNSIYKNILKTIKNLDEIEQLLIFFNIHNSKHNQLFRITNTKHGFKWQYINNIYLPINFFNTTNNGISNSINESIYAFFDLLDKKEKIIVKANLIITLTFNPSLKYTFEPDIIDINNLKEHLEFVKNNSNINSKVLIANSCDLKVKKRKLTNNSQIDNTDLKV